MVTEITSYDKMVMLLSSDWFQPFWAITGLNVDRKSRELLKLKLRKEVSNFMHLEDSYWNISFSRERILETKTNFLKIIDYQTQKSLRHDLFENPESILALASTAASLLFEESPRHIVMGMGDSIFHKCHEAWLSAQENPIDFEFECINSNSQWDIYLRGITKDLPGMLADFAFECFSLNASFARFSSNLRLTLDTDELLIFERELSRFASDLTGKRCRIFL